MLNASQKMKSTAAGEIPTGWASITLSTIIKELQSGVSVSGESRPANDDEFGVLKVSAVSNGCFFPKNNKAILSEDIHRARMKPRSGAILVSRSNTPELVGESARVVDCPANLFLPDKLWQISINTHSAVDEEWLSQTLHLRSVRSAIKGHASGTSKSMRNISKKSFLSIPIPFPPLTEQLQIAEILSTWDEALEKINKLIQAKQQRKQALIQQLLLGKKRLPGFKEEWAEEKLSSLFSRVVTKNKDGHTQVVTISAQKGLICQRDYFNKQIASKNLENYFVLKKGQFAYNKSYSKGYPMGAIKRLDRYNHGVVTTLYICFELTNPSKSCSDFWLHYFESGALNRGLTRIAHEGGRAHGLLNVTPKDFFEVTILSPSLEEQTAIANILTTCNNELNLLHKQRKTIDNQKRGLMQQLLTGKIRTNE